MRLAPRVAAAAGVGGLLLGGFTAASAAPATAAGCVSVSSGVQRQLSYTSTLPNGTKLSGRTLASVARAGATVTATVKIVALPAGASCVNLTLASYRAVSVPMTPTSYQTLYAQSSVTGVKVGSTVRLTVRIPATPGTKGPGCTNTHPQTQTGKGANKSGPYDSTCDGTASGNGQGKGTAKGKPCAGCVGNADNKNPKGQLPGPQDKNKGYECDKNQGIGKGNPAHSGCATGRFWQIDLVTGAPALPYIGTPPRGGKVLSYGSVPGSPKRLIDAAIGGA